ncbi:MAG: hypothetical protein AAB656_03495 [Patescibacteria group bacterium]
MHAYLVTGQDSNLIDKRVGELIAKEDAKRLDFPLQKIADLKELRKFASLSVSEKTAVVIDSIDKASIDAQNAFLKSLEEPQEKLIYVLTAKNQDFVVPTIVSRCQIIELRSMNYELSIEQQKRIREFLTMSVGQKLAVTSKITKREEVKIFLQEFISVGYGIMKEKPEIAFQLDEALKTLSAINKNGNVQIQLTNFVVSIET